MTVDEFERDASGYGNATLLHVTPPFSVRRNEYSVSFSLQSANPRAMVVKASETSVHFSSLIDCASRPPSLSRTNLSSLAAP